jgi:hypothetical protein
MEMEARSLPAETSKPLLINVKNYKADLLALKEQVKKAAAAASPADGARAELVREQRERPVKVVLACMGLATSWLCPPMLDA